MVEFQLSFKELDMRILSIAHLTMLDADPITMIEAAAYANAQAVGLRVIPRDAEDTVTRIVGNQVLIRNIRRTLRETGVRVLDVEAVWLRPTTRVEELEPALEVAAEIGAGHLLVLGFDPVRRRMQDNFGRICERAAAWGLRPVLEFMPYSTVKTLSDAHDLIVSASAKNAGLMVDSLHLSRCGGDPSEVAGYGPALFPYIQLSDAPAQPPGEAELIYESREARLYPLEGELSLGSFVDAFPATLPIAIEAPSVLHAHLPPRERAKKCVDATRKFLQSHEGQWQEADRSRPFRPRYARHFSFPSAAVKTKTHP